MEFKQASQRPKRQKLDGLRLVKFDAVLIFISVEAQGLRESLTYLFQNASSSLVLQRDSLEALYSRAKQSSPGVQQSP